jgi:RNA polymerase sigma factor (sigma-70 family)
VNDYRVKIKVRNNRILKAMEEINAEPGQKWCEANSISYTVFNNLINMTASPLDGKTKELSLTASKLCEVLFKSADDLWSNEQLRPLERNFTELEMSAEQVSGLLANQEEAIYIQDFDAQNFKDVLKNQMDYLHPRERKVLQLRYFNELTLEEIGTAMDIGKERVRQIEEKALRKLRHPRHSLSLGQFLPSREDKCIAKEKEERKDIETYITNPIINSGYYR